MLQQLTPAANIPRVPLPVAEPNVVLMLAKVTPDAVIVQVEYVYLFLFVLAWPQIFPREKIPRVLLPAAAPRRELSLTLLI
jgi:hypothetical protein